MGRWAGGPPYSGEELATDSYWERLSLFFNSPGVGELITFPSVEGHISKNTWAAQIELSRFKNQKKTQSWVD